MINNSNIFMELAIAKAKECLIDDEVPVGCVIVKKKDKKIIAITKNQMITLKDATAHAEILAIREACKFFNSYRLDDCILYTTLEPCPMCSGAIYNAKIDTIYFGAYDTRYHNLNSILYQKNAHKINVYGGIYEKECKEIITSYFKTKRK